MAFLPVTSQGGERMPMAKVVFTTNLRRHVDCPTMTAEGATVREVLAQVFAAQERLGAYVLDEQGALRKHMTILIDGRRIKDRERLSDPVAKESEVYVLQALSGG
jgi:molybdopterin converting factor small subunit